MHLKTKQNNHHNQTSAQREHDKNVSAFVRSMCITLRKIVSNYCFSVQTNIIYKILYFLMPFIENNRNSSPKNSKKESMNVFR